MDGFEVNLEDYICTFELDKSIPYWDKQNNEVWVYRQELDEWQITTNPKEIKFLKQWIRSNKNVNPK